MILDALVHDWPIAADLKRFVLLDKFDAQAIDGLMEFFKQGIEQTSDIRIKEKLKRSAEMLAKVQELEKADLLQNEEECKKLEEMMQHL